MVARLNLRALLLLDVAEWSDWPIQRASGLLEGRLRQVVILALRRESGAQLGGARSVIDLARLAGRLAHAEE